MPAKKGLFVLSLIAGLAILVINIYGFVLLRSRPGLPKEYKSMNIVRLDDVEIRSSPEIAFLLTRKTLHDPVTLVVKNGEDTKIVETTIVPYYRFGPYLITYLLVGLFAVAVGTACFLLKREDPKARIYYWLSLAFASPVILGGCFRLVRTEWPSLVPGVLFCLSYAFVMPLLLLFLMAFSDRPHKVVKRLALSSAAFFGLTISGAFLWANITLSIEIFRSVYLPFYAAFRVFTVVFMFVTTIYLAYLLNNAQTKAPREPFKWITLGLLLSFVPYTVLYQIPSIINPSRPIVNDEVGTLFFIFAPAAFALAIFRFKLIRLELVVRRSLVYSLLTVFTVGLYLFSIQVFQPIFANILSIRNWVIRAAAVLLAAAAFRPAQSRIQKFVDKAFFRQAYDYRLCLRKFVEGAQEIVDRNRLVDSFLATLTSILPLERTGICVHDISGEIPEIYLESGECGGLRDTESACFEAGRILATRRATSSSLSPDFSEEARLIERGWEMIIPLIFKASAIKGVLGLGRKKSGQTFSREDIELVDGLAGELAVHLEKIRLHEEVIVERTSKEKLDELNRLKTEFISSVSHELRTPMASIQGLAEMLGSGKIKDGSKREEILWTIAAESSRLSRMIHNILDFGKIEHQAIAFHFRAADFGAIMKEALEVFRHQLDDSGFVVGLDLPERPVILKADRDALKQCLINLIDNAMKYSAETKEIGLRLIDEPERAEIQVWDKGMGIPEDEREKIFEGFYRASQGTRQHSKGVGLGLKIVKHIVNGHGGRILVDSRPGKGSTFRLIFPKP